MSGLANCAGKFITFEGIEGVGKSTQVALLVKALQEEDVDILATREPGGTEIAEEIRNVLLTHHKEKMTTITELLLMFAARAQHVAMLIKPALQAGRCVISDRFTDATYAYQGGGRGVPLQSILQLENLVLGEYRPDLTIVLDIDDVAACLVRAKGIGTGDRIEMEEKSFFERARKVYLARAHDNPSRYKVINAAQPIEAVHADILNAINEKFDSK